MKKILLFLFSILLSSCCTEILSSNEELIVREISTININEKKCIYIIGQYNKKSHLYDKCFIIEDKIGKYNVGDTLIIIKK